MLLYFKVILELSLNCSSEYFAFLFILLGGIGPGATWSSKLMGLSVSLVLSLVRVVAVVNSFDSGTLTPVCLTFKSSLDNCRSIKWKGFVHLSSRNTIYNHREVIFSQYTKSKETIAVLLKVLSKILIEETACVFILIFQRFILGKSGKNIETLSFGVWLRFSGTALKCKK